MDAEEARYAAIRKFGGSDQMQETYRRRSGLRRLKHDERPAFRRANAAEKRWFYDDRDSDALRWYRRQCRDLQSG